MEDPETKLWLDSYAAEKVEGGNKDKFVSRITDTVEMAALFQKQMKKHWSSPDVGKVSFGLDCWSASNRTPYFGVSASWINEKWNLSRTVTEKTWLIYLS